MQHAGTMLKEAHGHIAAAETQLDEAVSRRVRASDPSHEELLAEAHVHAMIAQAKATVLVATK
jgi:hypothetical protein